ncbi:hypothetical protein HDV06_001682 [Boothiomyces sp. JEL0866]|nr:hypothetical protein HDV06_001682 [Boothiomyces sp. JEL0866]
MGTVLNIALALFVLLGAVLYPNISTTFQKGRFFDKVRHEPNPKCKLIERKSIANKGPELAGCEDGQVHESGLTYWSCAKNLTERRLWFPPTDKLDKSIYSHSGITIYNPTDGKSTALRLKDFDSEFCAHGLSILTHPKDSNKVIIAAINHKRTGSVIEKFIHTVGTDEAQHVETISDQELLYSPNNLVLLGENEFYATNDISSKSHLMRQVEIVGRQPWGWVVYHDESGFRKVAKDITYANGIAISPDKELLYIMSVSNGEIKIYEIKEGNGLRYVDTADIKISGDNLNVDPHTGVIYTAGLQRMTDFLQSIFMGKQASSIAAKITKNEAKDVFYGKKYNSEVVYVEDGSFIDFATVAAVDSKNKKSYVSGLFSKGIVVCDYVF